MAIEIIVVADVKSGSRIWSPAEQKLALDVRRDRIEVYAAAGEDETRELISSAERNNIFIESQQMSIVSPEALLGKVERDIQWG